MLDPPSRAGIGVATCGLYHILNDIKIQIITHTSHIRTNVRVTVYKVFHAKNTVMQLIIALHRLPETPASNSAGFL
jgi:hypothetical protein